MIATLTGSNTFLLNQALHEKMRAFVKLHGDLALERLDGEESSYNQMLGSVESLPFLSQKKMVVLRTPSASKEYVEHFEDWLKHVNDSTDVIIVEPKLDKRLVYYKLLKKLTDFQEFNEADVRDLPNWLNTQAKHQGGTLSLSDARYLVERLGPNQQLLYSELQKLLTYNLNITRQTIDELTEPTPQSTIFQLLDAAFGGDLARALKLYEDQRQQRVEPLVIMGMLAWQLHVLAVVKAAGKRSPNEIAREAKLSPFVVQKSLQIARKLTMAELRSLVRQVTDLDMRLKTTSIDADDALQQLLVDISQMI